MKNGKEKPEDIKNRAYKFSLEIVTFCDTFSNSKLSMLIILKQLIRAATSIAANLIEAKAASSKRDFINFNYYSLKSANETVYWLNLLQDSQSLHREKILKLATEADEISRILASCILKLKK